MTHQSASEQMNVLTDAERAEGWQLLFDGRDASAHWRGFQQSDLPAGWQVVEGTLHRADKAGDIITREQYENLELQLEWKVAGKGNSGIFFRVSEDRDKVYETGPEFQVLNNLEHKDGAKPETSAGANYALHAPTRDMTRPVGEWNHTHIVVNGAHVEHWLNGEKVVEYELWSEDWERRVAASKFAEMPRYGRNTRGHVALQDHNDPVWYRNIKIKVL